MILKKNLLRESHLYAIIDRDVAGNKILKIAKSAASAGADIIQLRDKSSSLKDVLKTAKAIKTIAKRYGIPLIINDRLDIALAVDADGLHIGQGDIGIRIAKKLLKKNSLIGVTVKNLKQALRAKAEGATYLGVGPVFRTPIKGDISPKGFRLLERVRGLNMPFFAIGGIDRKNIAELAGSGFKNVAVIRAISKAKNPHMAASFLKKAIL